MQSNQSQSFKIAFFQNSEERIMIHQNLSEFTPTSLCRLMDVSHHILMYISNSFENVQNEAFSWRTTNLWVVWSIGNYPKQAVVEIIKKKNKHITGYGHYEIEDSLEAEYKNPQESENQGDAWKVFVNSQSTALHEITTFRLKWEPQPIH
ncbi:unnamed protein product [Ilex paraguariensis]|uniref:Uncharacterized protein n=1 Tax=Ilex paraguariensis TaxID=185542 RepID=A0ABC8TYH6_9AQUA